MKKKITFLGLLFVAMLVVSGCNNSKDLNNRHISVAAILAQVERERGIQNTGKFVLPQKEDDRAQVRPDILPDLFSESRHYPPDQHAGQNQNVILDVFSRTVHFRVFSQNRHEQSGFGSTGVVYATDDTYMYIATTGHSVDIFNDEHENVTDVSFFFADGTQISLQGERLAVVFDSDLDVGMLRIPRKKDLSGIQDMGLIDYSASWEADSVVIHHTQPAKDMEGAVFATVKGLYDNNFIYRSPVLYTPKAKHLRPGDSGSPICSSKGVVGIVFAIGVEDYSMTFFSKIEHFEGLKKSFRRPV
ncbi:MAG: trypsin-like peptidase domain-containing protein [Candidatus Pacebacteria bacterium]|nr:trypsin-like peptidase domain-containing protein [Candidatus Paceibacterota bacterium]